MKTAVAVIAAVLVVVLFGFSGAFAAEKPATPETLKGAATVDDGTVKANHGKWQIFDVRKKAEYVEAHIPGAVSVPYEEKSEYTATFDMSKDAMDLSKFPADKNAFVVVYCNGPHCWKSYKAAAMLVKAGYKNVQYYREGFPGWKAKGYPVE